MWWHKATTIYLAPDSVGWKSELAWARLGRAHLASLVHLWSAGSWQPWLGGLDTGASPHGLSPFRLALVHSRGILRIPKESKRANPKLELLSSSLLITMFGNFPLPKADPISKPKVSVREGSARACTQRCEPMRSSLGQLAHFLEGQVTHLIIFRMWLKWDHSQFLD